MGDFSSTDKMVLEFYGKGCLNCRIMEPILRDLELIMPNVHFYRIDADERPDLVQMYHITSLPTLLLLRHSQVLSTIVGVKTRQTLYNQINEILNYA